MSDGDFWYATATRMLAPLLFAAAFGGRDMDDVIRWVDTQEETEVLDLLAAAGRPRGAARGAVGLRQGGSPAQLDLHHGRDDPRAVRRRGAGGTATRRPVRPVRRPRATGGRGTNTLYLCAPAHDQRRLTPPVRLGGRARSSSTSTTGWPGPAGPLDPPLLVVLDEAANIAPLPDLDALASTAAGHGVQLVTIWHDLAQLTARYGPGPPRSSTTTGPSCSSRASRTRPPWTTPATSSGDEEVYLPATTRGGGGPSTTHSPTRRRLAPADALRRIPTGRGVLVYGELPPARLRLRTWFDDPVLAARAGPGSGPGARAGHAPPGATGGGLRVDPLRPVPTGPSRRWWSARHGRRGR